MKKISPFMRVLRGCFSIPWYPIVFSLYPALALLAYNFGQVEPTSGLRAMLFSALLALLFFLVFWLLLRHPHRAAFLGLLWLILFFFHGHLFDLIVERVPDFSPTPWLPAAWGVFALVSVIWVTRRGSNFVSIAPALNLVVLGLVVVAAFQAFPAHASAAGHRVSAENAPIQELQAPSGKHLPDVYYFVLDSYGREDLLREAYSYDNSSFIAALRDTGFYVADCSQSNYVRTEISLASSLNMMYLQDLDSAFKPETTVRNRLWDSLKHSTVRYNFESLDYKTVNFATGFAWMELRDADKFYTPPPFAAGMTEFEDLFLRTTLARYIKELGWVDPDAIFAQNFRDRFNMVFNSLDDLASDPDPTFAYIHVISPHPPFVFGPDGKPTNPADFWNEKRQYPPKPYMRGYTNQLAWLNKKMLDGMDVILQNSEIPPIIIIQGDHGPWLQPQNKRMWILNAYYLPGHAEELYSSITPVNTFRLVFDEYFGGQYSLLEDLSYFSPVPKLYEFHEIPNECE